MAGQGDFGLARLECMEQRLQSLEDTEAIRNLVMLPARAGQVRRFRPTRLLPEAPVFPSASLSPGTADRRCSVRHWLRTSRGCQNSKAQGTYDGRGAPDGSV
jgi:hypothetical protein